MKKALDQTVRELKREVNKKVLKVPGIEQKVLDATSNEPWGPHGQLLLDISEATRNYHEYQMIMNVMWKRINDTGKNWRHVYKALIVLDYLVAHGSERIIDEIREHAYQISTLSNFQYIDSGGRDQGSNVRRKCQSLVALVNDKERIQEVRQKAMVNKDKYRSPYSMGGANRSSSYSGNGDRYDDDRFEGRYGNKDEDRNGYGRERDWGNRDDDRYDRGGDLYNRDGDRYGRDSDERFGRDSYRDDDYRGGRGNDDQFGSRNKNFDGDRGRSFDDDDHYSSRSGGGRTDEASHGERRLEQNLSEQNVGAPPGYEEAIRDAHNNVRVEGSRDGGTLAAPAPKAFSPSSSKAGLPSGSTIQSPSNVVPEVSASSQRKEINEFDEFDPRGSVLESASQSAAYTTEMDLFGNPSAADPINSLALVPVTSYEGDTVTNLGFGTNFVAMPLASTAMNQPSEDPFGDSPFKATPQGGFPAQQQDFTPPSGSIGGGFEPLTPAAPKMETIPTFDFGDSLGGLTYAANGPATSVPSQGAQPEFQSTNMNLLPQSGPSAPLSPQAALLYPQGAPPVAPTNLQAAPMNILSQSAPPLASQAALTTWAGPAAKPQPPSKDKLEPKSTVWADTLSRGLVNLDISGSKINPLADIGIDFDSMNRMEKRKEKKSSTAPGTSTIAMGRAMGAGSGIGRAGANGLAPSPNPMTMGYGMGGGGGAGRGIGLGAYGGGMNQQPMGLGMGMNMGVGQGAPMRPLTGVPPLGPGVVPGVAYNPTYGSQQAYGGGYR